MSWREIKKSRCTDFCPPSAFLKCNLDGVQCQGGYGTPPAVGGGREPEAQKKTGLDFRLAQEEAEAERVSAASPDTDAECPFRASTTKTTFRSDAPGCHPRGRALQNRNRQTVSTLDFLFDQSVGASPPRDPACYFSRTPHLAVGPGTVGS